MLQMTVPDEAVKYILFQRALFLRFPDTFTYRVLNRILPFSIYNRLVEREGKIYHSSIKAEYKDNMSREYLSIRDSLPKTCSSILDIGCGVAGIDVLLNNHYEGKPTFYLLDKTKIEKSVFYDFKHRGAFYNSLDIAKEMLIQNGISERSVHCLEATDANEIDIHRKVDLVISLISWGFHYPIETYLERVYDILIEGGSLILDVRKGTNGIEELNNKFGRVDVVYDGVTGQRALVTK
jgi:SAM-dependent methyltransferase